MFPRVDLGPATYLPTIFSLKKKSTKTYIMKFLSLILLGVMVALASACKDGMMPLTVLITVTNLTLYRKRQLQHCKRQQGLLRQDEQGRQEADLQTNL